MYYNGVTVNMTRCNILFFICKLTVSTLTYSDSYDVLATKLAIL